MSYSERIKLVQGDTRPILVVTLTDETSGDPINVSSATVRLKFREAGQTGLTATIVGAVTDGNNGVVAFSWSTAPTSLSEDGNYEGEIEITFSDSTIQTVYDLLKFKVRPEF